MSDQTSTIWDYSGVIAEAYDHFFGGEPYFDQAFYAQRLQAAVGPALELACGTGRLLLPLLRDGHVIEGLDTSADMLAICRRKAASMQLHPTLHQLPMQDFDLPNRYGVIFCAVNSFQILVTDDEIAASLGCCLRALRPGGELILTLADRPRSWSAQWRERRRLTLDDGALVVIDELTAQHETLPRWRWDLRWRISRGAEIEEFVQRFDLRDYSSPDITAFLARAGFVQLQDTRGYTASNDGEAAQRIVFARRPEV